MNSINLSNFSNLDVVGDIHGFGDELVTLLVLMGYVEHEPYNFSHPEGRKVLFIGDYIDRGIRIMKTLRIVRNMQESGNAIALMGNHEFNFLCYTYKDADGKTFRDMNKKTCKETFTDVALDDELDIYLDWMARLPLFFENDSCRGVHAHWDKKSIDIIRERGIPKLDEQGLRNLHADEELLKAYETVLKGAEVKIDEAYQYRDKEGKHRAEARIKWWTAHQGTTMGEHFASIPNDYIDKPYLSTSSEFILHYGHDEKPVFFGHYWLSHTEINIQRNNVCCIDFSIAKDGLLAAYRFSGEETLLTENLVHHKMV